MSGDGFDGEVVGASSLLSAGFQDGEHRFDETAARVALRAERELPPVHGLTQRALGRVVGGLDLVVIHEGPQPLGMPDQLRAGGLRGAGDGIHAAQQKTIDLLRKGCACD